MPCSRSCVAGAPEQKIKPGPTTAEILDGLIEARVEVEQGGTARRRASLTDVVGLKALSALVNGLPGTDVLLPAANINSLERVDILEQPIRRYQGLLLGRRQRIAHGGAAEASPGEEPVDLAVSVPPSLEVVGETPANGNIESQRPHPLRAKNQGLERIRRHPCLSMTATCLTAPGPDRSACARGLSRPVQRRLRRRNQSALRFRQRGSSGLLRADPRLPAARREGASARAEHRDLPRAWRPPRGDPADRGDARALPQRVPHPRRHRGRIMVAARQTHAAHRPRHPDRRQCG